MSKIFTFNPWRSLAVYMLAALFMVNLAAPLLTALENSPSIGWCDAYDMESENQEKQGEELDDKVPTTNTDQTTLTSKLVETNSYYTYQESVFHPEQISPPPELL